ncbi:surface antigen (D15) [Desulfarculus baarsii DSM 2075]|uniref:Surface antigen (D15) n=1 Tax=Desulfarculus baarsii (strain ATCC 33931 / DSM 2075 / LMG 7858 / VKM B-1802 / 2st14) TaxID=644282 RepID=E1QF73_DESB2|nr:surface antigen (D15) [Desulfarculus baarsii DSM 2075]
MIKLFYRIMIICAISALCWPGPGQALERPGLVGKALEAPRAIGQALETAVGARDDQGGPPLITAVDLTGVDNAPKDTLLGMLEAAPRVEPGAEKAKRYDPLMAQRDIRRIQRAYEAHGYFNVQVKARLEPGALPGVTRLIYDVHENSPVLIDKILLTLPDEPAQRRWSRRLVRVSGLKAGERFSLAAYEKAKGAIKAYLAERAHPKAKVRGQARIYPEELRAEVALEIDPGAQYFFGPPVVVGNKRMSERYILSRLKFTPGQPFKASVLEASQQELLNSGFFDSAVLSPDYLAPIQGKRLPIQVVVDERPAHGVQLGLGWGTEEGARLRLDQTNRNILGLNEEISFRGKISEIYQGLVAAVRLPQTPLERTETLVRVGVEQPDNQAYESRNHFAMPVLETHLDKYARAWVGYLYEQSRMVNLKAAVPDKAFENQTFLISSVKAGVNFDSRDSPLNPTRGSQIALEVEWATNGLGSELSFVRPQIEASQIFGLPGWRGWYVALRAKAGFTIGYGDDQRIPLIRRFFPGGPDSVRGYPYQCLGPLDSAGKPLGGEAMIVGNAELRFPLWRELGGVIFLDAGNAYESIDTDMGALRYAAGLGLRYNTPVGPVRVDWGYQLNPDPNAPIDDNQFYFSVGQAF